MATRERSFSRESGEGAYGVKRIGSEVSVESIAERIQVPLLGFGTFNSYENHDEIAAAVKEAIKTGYRHINLAKMVSMRSM